MFSEPRIQVLVYTSFLENNLHSAICTSLPGERGRGVRQLPLSLLTPPFHRIRSQQ